MSKRICQYIRNKSEAPVRVCKCNGLGRKLILFFWSEVRVHCRDFPFIKINFLINNEAPYFRSTQAIQRTFTYKNNEVQRLNYWERLHELKLYSLQRRRERYIIIYIWTITQNTVANNDGTMRHKIKTRKHPRHGTQCVIQSPTNRNPAQYL